MFHLVKRAIDVARLKFNPAAAVDNDICIQFELARVERAVLHAVIQREAHQVNVIDPALLQVIGEPGVAAMSVIEEGAVTINVSLGSLVENMSDSARIKGRGEFRAICVLNAVRRPENLFNVIENDAV